MLKLPNKIKFMLFSMVYGMMVTVPAVAEDIEIYTTASTATTTTSTQANVLFILDTSGSMDTQVQERPPYDPNTNYSAGGGCFDPAKAYILPYGGFYAWIHCHWYYSQIYGTPEQLSHVNLSSFVCGAGGSIVSTGFYSGRLSQYRGGEWRDSITTGNDNDFVECENDQGVHGETGTGTLVWASRTGAPWSSVESDEIDWGSRGFGATLHSGNYANYLITAPVTNTGTRLSVMQQAIKDLVDASSGINIGLMRFSSNGEGGMIATPIDSVDDATHAQRLKDAVDAMSASGGTPLSESFYEAALYFQGRGEDYGDSTSPFHSVADSKSGSSYISPITGECQKNYAVILTDGDPSGDSLSTAQRGNLNKENFAIGGCGDNCLDEIAKSIGLNDQNTSIDGDQFVSTFTIGFAIENQLLLDTANESFLATGSGKRYLAEDATSLADVLNEITNSVYEVSTTFTSPAVSVNAFNRATHLDDLYFTVFQPGESPRWAGNLKKYKLAFIEDPDDSTKMIPKIVDSLGLVAVDDNTGFFRDEARSYWTDGVENDGKDVAMGGAANEFELGREVYTYTNTYNESNGVLTPPGAFSADLTTSANRVRESNAAITEDMLGVAVSDEYSTNYPLRDAVLDWAEGIDVTDANGNGDRDEARQDMGDPLHSEPALVIYGGDEDNPDLVAYTATNDGYLHAYDVDDGSEIFSFIPQKLLINLNTVMNDTTGPKTYGLDGNVVAWINDENEDGTINGSDHVYLYVGMRRGGKNIYSLDVTDRENPKLRWVIEGGTGDYAALGQTWSTINVEKIKDGADEKTVLIFGGGYDTNQDDVAVRSTDSVGNAVFIADAESGQLLWSAGPSGTTVLSDMQYSIPARVKPLDLSGDGFTDRLYVVDMGGQIFRFDIDNDNGDPLSGSVEGGRIWDLADSGETNARRFYYPPDVALIAERGKSAYLALGITSGYRAHPLDTTIQDRIYLLKDNDVYTQPASGYVTQTESDLYDATLNLVAGDGNAQQNEDARTALDSSEGWLIKLDDETSDANYIGEKGLSEALFIEGVLIVTTYIPDDPAAVVDSCTKESSGTGKVFYLDLLDASPAFPSDADVRPERHKQLRKEGIPPSPNVIITQDGQATECVGTECGLLKAIQGVRRTFWYEVEK